MKVNQIIYVNLHITDEKEIERCQKIKVDNPAITHREIYMRGVEAIEKGVK